MQVSFTNVDQSGNIIDADASLAADEAAAAAILDSTIPNDIPVVFYVGNGFLPGPNTPVNSGALSLSNAATEVSVTYDTLQPALLASGVFNDTNLPPGENIDGKSRFYLTSAQAKALGFPEPNNAETADGFIGHTPSLSANDRIPSPLHERGHVMARTRANKGTILHLLFPDFPLTRFRAGGTRQFFTVGVGYFSLDNG